MASVREIFRLPAEKKLEAYKKHFDGLLKAKNAGGIEELVEHAVNKEGTDQYGRTYVTPELLPYLWTRLAEQPDEGAANMDDFFELENLEKLVMNLTATIRPKDQDFPDALMGCIKLESEVHQALGDFEKAARALSSFKFAKYRTCKATTSQKVEWFVDCAEDYLELEEPDTGAASQNIRRAHVMIKDIRDNERLVFRFKTAQARVLDQTRKFFEAAICYLEVSQLAAGLATEEDLLTALEHAVTCAILSKAGPQRSRVLAMLVSDERSRQLPNACAGLLLEKMFKERIIRASEVQQFQKILQTHQNATTSTGMTVLENSMVEHNILAASKIYNNIKVDQLAALLGVPSAQAEKLASNMIEQGRMTASIDQIEGIVEFEGVGTGSLYTWDDQIGGVCTMVNRLLETISKTPKYKGKYEY